MRKRSKYRPKGVIPDTMTWVKAGFKKVGSLPTAGVALKLKNHEALDSMMRGEGTKDHVDVLIAAFNMAEALYRINPNLGLNYAPAIKDAQDAIYSMARRGVQKGRFLFTGPELQVIRYGIDIHDAQIDECIVGEMEAALELVSTTILNKQARPIVETA